METIGNWLPSKNMLETTRKAAYRKIHEHPTASAVTALVTAWAGIKLAKAFCSTLYLNKKRAQKQKTRNDTLDDFRKKFNNSQVSQARREEIIKMTFSELQMALQSGDVKASEALFAYQMAALQVHDNTNCLVEPILEAETWALERDLYPEEKGPLHGIPISVKENYGLQGYDCTAGLAQWIDRPFSEDCIMIQVLKKQGAVPFIRTNIPQTMIAWETSNPIFGATTHPHKSGRGVGGSSGGEAALIAGGGSVLGVGSDIGGSIRIPSHVCGICGFKATVGRLSSKGGHPILKGQTAVSTVYGPMGKDVDTLVTFMRAMMIPYLWKLDPQVIPLPFREEIFKDQRKIRIGYFDNFEFLNAVPACRRGVAEAKEALERAGYELVPWMFPKLGELTAHYWISAVAGDQGKEMMDAVKYDRLDIAFKTSSLLFGGPTWFKKLVAYLTKFPLPRVSRVMTASQGFNTVFKWWEFNKELENFKQQVIKSLHEAGIEALLSPGLACPALPLGVAGQVGTACIYTQVYNVLNFPAGSVPVTKVTAEDEAAMATFPTPDPWHKMLKKGLEGSEGLPINVQIATLPYDDETCLRIMLDLEKALKSGS